VLCSRFQINLLSKVNEINRLKDEQKYFDQYQSFYEDENDINYDSPRIRMDRNRGLPLIDAMNIIRRVYGSKLEERRAMACNKYLVQMADLNFKAKNVGDIIAIVMDRNFKDEDKQYQLDIDDVIEEHIYQCVQFFNQDIMMDKIGDEEEKNDNEANKMGNKSGDGFLKSLLANDGVQDKNYLWAIMNRELTNKGNYLNVEG